MQQLSRTILMLFAFASVATSQTSHRDDGVTATTLTLPTGISSPPSSIQTGCPTVTETRELCSTCGVPACLGLATVTQYPCDCPAKIATVYLDFPCSESCRGIWCSTSYDIVTASATTCPTTTTTGTGTNTDTGTTSTKGTSTKGTTTTGTTSSSSSRGSGPVSTAAAARLAPFKLWI